jgi:hypothetical protein
LNDFILAVVVELPSYIVTCLSSTSDTNTDRQLESLKPVTDEQVFYDKFLCDKFYLPSARVYMQQILYDKFSYAKFYLLNCVKVSEKGVYRRHDRKIIIVRWPITSNAQITLTH